MYNHGVIRVRHHSVTKTLLLKNGCLHVLQSNAALTHSTNCEATASQRPDVVVTCQLRQEVLTLSAATAPQIQDTTALASRPPQDKPQHPRHRRQLHVRRSHAYKKMIVYAPHKGELASGPALQTAPSPPPCRAPSPPLPRSQEAPAAHSTQTASCKTSHKTNRTNLDTTSSSPSATATLTRR